MWKYVFMTIVGIFGGASALWLVARSLTPTPPSYWFCALVATFVTLAAVVRSAGRSR